MNTMLRMKIVVPAAAGVPGAETTSDKPARGGSTDPREFLAMRARQKEARRRARRWKLGFMTVACAGTIGLAFAMPRWRQHALALPAEPSAEVSATTSASAAPSTEEAAAVAAAPETATASAAPPSGCEDDFSRRQWRAAIVSCTKAFEAAPDGALAMKVAHSHWAHGETAHAGSWAARAVELETDDADAFVLIGHAERKAGHPAAAIAAYRRYLHQAPSGWHAVRVRAAIRELKAAMPAQELSASN